MLGIERHHPPPGGTGGGLNAHTVRQGLGQQAVGIGIPQVVLGEEGQLIEVLHALDAVRRDPLFLHLPAIVGHVVPHVPHLLYQALVLPRQDLLPGGGLNFGLVVAFHMRSPFLCIGPWPDFYLLYHFPSLPSMF